MPDFHVVSKYVPSGDQPEAIDTLARGLEQGIARADAARRHRFPARPTPWQRS